MNKNVISLNETTGIVTDGDVKVVTLDGKNSDMSKILRKENRLEQEKAKVDELAKCKKRVNNRIQNKKWLSGCFALLSGFQLAAAAVVKTTNPILWATLILTAVVVTPIVCIANNIKEGDFYKLIKIRDEKIPKKIKESKIRIKKLEKEIGEMKENVNYVETDLTASRDYIFNIPSRKNEFGGYYNTPCADAKVLRLTNDRSLSNSNNAAKRR